MPLETSAKRSGRLSGVGTEQHAREVERREKRLAYAEKVRRKSALLHRSGGMLVWVKGVHSSSVL